MENLTELQQQQQWNGGGEQLAAPAPHPPSNMHPLFASATSLSGHISPSASSLHSGSQAFASHPAAFAAQFNFAAHHPYAAAHASAFAGMNIDSKGLMGGSAIAPSQQFPMDAQLAQMQMQSTIPVSAFDMQRSYGSYMMDQMSSGIGYPAAYPPASYLPTATQMHQLNNTGTYYSG